jgi:hypothetical protein
VISVLLTIPLIVVNMPVAVMYPLVIRLPTQDIPLEPHNTSDPLVVTGPMDWIPLLVRMPPETTINPLVVIEPTLTIRLVTVM